MTFINRFPEFQYRDFAWTSRWQQLFSIANQLRFGLVFLVLSSLSLTGGILIYSSFKTQLRESELQQKVRSELAAEKINAYIDDLQRKLSYLARVQGLTNLPIGTQKSLIEGLIRHNTAYEMVAIYNRNGESMVTASPSGQVSLGNLANSSLFTIPFQRQEDYIDSPAIHPKTNELVTTIAVPIRNQQDRVDGVLLAKINLKFLEFVVSQTEVGKTGYVYIIDNRKFLIAKKGSSLNSFQPEDISKLPFLENLATTQTKSLTMYRGLNGVPVLGAIAPIASTNWAAIVELPITEAYAPVYSLIFTMGGALVLATAIATGIGFLFCGKIISPLRRLTAAAAQISGGNLNTQVEIQEKNELGILAETFNKMTSQLDEFYQSLEMKVAERTAELLTVNRTLENEIVERKQAQEELQQALQELQQAQSQLIQSEKMSSLGQLVAGVAHEINNPVNFIHGNLTYMEEYSSSLFDVVSLYQKNYPNPALEIQEKLEEIEIDFLAEDMPKILSSMKMGTDRIRQIVLSLRNFSRLDESDMKLVDIHEGIESTLLILQNRLKAKSDFPPIEIVKEYGQLPLIECYAGQLNQVFMNIIANGIDAIVSRYTDDSLPNSLLPGCIKIRTVLTEANTLSIRISDNGVGIPESIKMKIFNPFFTTKPIGQGTGLGLSITYQIVVQKHGGKLLCLSEAGQGTEFCIEIPVQRSES